MPKSKTSSSTSTKPERLRNVCITVNNWSDQDISNLEALNYKYLIIGKEKSKKGTPHLQVYLQLINTHSLSGLQKKLPKAHIEPAVSTPLNCLNYCKKGGDYKEYGSIKKPGARNDLDEIRQLALDEGMKGVSRIATAAQLRVAETFLSYHEEPRTWKPNVFWIHGPAGVGKGRLADAILKSRTDQPDDIFVLCPLPSEDDSPEPYEKSDPTKWWNGYDAHSNVIIDDFRGSWWPITYLLKILDRRKFQVENKGGMRQFKARNIIITSIFSPEDSYKKCFKTDLSPTDQLIQSQMIDKRQEPYSTETPLKKDRVDEPETFADGEPKDQLLRRIDEIIRLDYTFDEENKYIEHQARYTNHKLNGTSLLNGRTTSSGIVKFDVDPVPTTRGYKPTSKSNPK